MSTMFERFAKMAKEEFGYTVVRSSNQEKVTFESLFGISVESIEQYELPYSVLDEPSYYDRLMMPKVLGLSYQMNIFKAEENRSFAA